MDSETSVQPMQGLHPQFPLNCEVDNASIERFVVGSVLQYQCGRTFSYDNASGNWSQTVPCPKAAPPLATTVKPTGEGPFELQENLKDQPPLESVVKNSLLNSLEKINAGGAISVTLSPAAIQLIVQQICLSLRTGKV